MDKNMKIEFSSALTDIKNINPSFDIGKLRIAYTGKNRNNTFIGKDSFERAIPTMYNCPVVANYKRDNHEIGSHDGEFIKDKDGKVKYVNITQPIGLVPESASWNWEEVSDKGVLHQYLCTEVVLWKRQEAYEIIKENGVTKQSMEIEVTDGEMLDDYYEIKDFSFTAFCLLGTAEPCFESAALFTFTEKEAFEAEYTEMLKEFKLAFASTDINKKEGNKDLKLKELLEKYSITEEDLKFDVEGLSDEDLEAKFAEVYESNDDDSKDDPDEQEDMDEPDNDDNDDGADFALSSQVLEALSKAVSAEKITTEYGGEYSKRWMLDFDEEIKEVYYIDEEDGNIYGCPYTVDGDDVVVDFENQKRKKRAFVDYVEGTTEDNFDFELVKTNITEYVNALSGGIDATEFERLKEFEKDILTAKRESAEKTLFEKFEEKLGDNEEFKALKEKASEYELDDLEKELFALVGKVDFTLSLKKMGADDDGKNAKPFIGFEAAFAANESNDEKKMTSFMEKYLN